MTRLPARTIMPGGKLDNALSAIGASLQGGERAVIFLRDFTPEAPERETLSSWVRGTHNRRGDEPELDRIGLVLCSATPAGEWGAAQGGFNVGCRLDAGTILHSDSPR